MSDAQLVSVERTAAPDPYDDQPRDGAAADAENPLLRIHALMRGRYLAALALALLLGAGLATGGFFLGRRVYVSSGAVRVSPVREVLDQGSTSTLPNYE